MAIKETPVNFRVYYKSMRAFYTEKKKTSKEALQELNKVVADLHESVKSNKDTYLNEFGIDLFKYDEFVNNRYSTGEFLKLAKGAFMNRKNNYTLVSDLFDLYNLSKKQKEVADLEHDIELCDNIINIDLSTYRDILWVFYCEVQRQMILKGKGYAFEGSLGWVCINRCKLKKTKPHLDYSATRKNKEALIAQGKRPYREEEAKWCRQNNIEYDGVRYCVFQKIEHVYEIPLIGCKLPDGRKYKLEIADYRGQAIKGKTNAQLIEECNRDVEQICKLPVSIRTKLYMCLEIDKTLYTNFIRNENQETISVIKASR